MKKQLINTIKKGVFTIAVAAVVILGSSTGAFALPDKPVNTAKIAEISYKGIEDNMLVFKVNYKNETSDDFILFVRNEYNEIIYSKKFDGKPLNTNVYLADFPQDCKVTLAIKAGQKMYSQSFEINTDVKTVSEYNVSKL